jgi:predicted Zn-dependent peptidase
LALEWHSSAGSIAREREIIASEIQLYQDDAEWLGFNSALRSLYGDHIIAREIAGSTAGLEAISESLLAAWHRAFYKPANMGLFLCGDFDHNEVLQISAQALERHAMGAVAPLFNGAVSHPVVLEQAQRIEVSLPISNPQIYLPYADVRPAAEGVDLLRREVALELLLDIMLGPASAAFEDWYQRGLILGDSFASEVYAERSYCFCLIIAETFDPQGLAEEIGRVFAEMRESGEWESDLGRAQRKAYGQIVRSFESVENCVSLMQAATSCGAHPSDYIAVCQSISADDLADGLRYCLRPFAGGRVFINPREQMRVST